jgi:hypothetical protein
MMFAFRAKRKNPATAIDERPACLRRSRFDFEQLRAAMNEHVKKTCLLPPVGKNTTCTRCKTSKKRGKQRVSHRIIFAAISHTHCKTMRSQQTPLCEYTASAQSTQDVRANRVFNLLAADNAYSIENVMRVAAAAAH